ncbi:MAG: stage III sporulation protein AF [Bacillota bacterium]
METLRTLVQNLIFTIMLAVFLEMLLPNGEMRRYTRMVMGLMVVVALIQGANGITGGALFREVEEYAWRSPVDDGKKIDILDQGRKLEEENRKQAMEKYRQGIEKQVVALVDTRGPLRVSGASVAINDNPAEKEYGKISGMTITFTEREGSGNSSINPIEPVAVSVGEEPGKAEDGKIPRQYEGIARTAAKRAADYYNLSPDQIKVKFE